MEDLEALHRSKLLGIRNPTSCAGSVADMMDIAATLVTTSCCDCCPCARQAGVQVRTQPQPASAAT
eukprot:2839908-Pleurochrysis_carterae.AAC.1